MTTTDGEETSSLLRRLPGVQALDLELVSSDARTPAVRRLRFCGDGLDRMDAFAGQDLMVAVPAPARTHFRRRYTIRHLDAEKSSVDLDIVLHGDGPGARWAAGVQPGDRVEAVGPRGKIGLAEGAEWHLFCGDESAVPAVSTMIEALPSTARALAVLEVSGPEEEQAPDEPACDLEMHWAHRTSEPGTGQALTDALSALELPPGRGHAYVFGELRQVAAARAVLLERAVDPADIDHKAYWRRGVANAAHGEPERPPTS